MISGKHQPQDKMSILRYHHPWLVVLPNVATAELRLPVENHRAVLTAYHRVFLGDGNACEQEETLSLHRNLKVDIQQKGGPNGFCGHTTDC